tara:strand:- start:939 stop:1166 length:228 start_codon:yes stop_codon:yes gene_type:complete
MGGDNRPLIIQPIGESMKLYFMNEDMLQSLKVVLNHMHYVLRNSDDEDLDQIYNHVLVLDKLTEQKSISEVIVKK